MAKSKSTVFFDGKCWYHRMKTMDEEGKIKYGKKSGFDTKEAAELSYMQYEEKYKAAQREYQMKGKNKLEITLRDYLIYWFEEVFIKRIETSTAMIGRYTLYNLILPKMEKDIKLKYVNTEYIDDLLERVSKLTNSAGNKSREFLSIAMKEAVVEGYIKYDPIPNTKPYPRPKPKVRILNKNQIGELIAAAKSDNWYLEIMLALCCGLRKGEILGLKFSDFDLEKRTVSIQRQLANHPVIDSESDKLAEKYERIEKPPKTENGYRKIKVPEFIMEELQLRKIKTDMDKAEFGDLYEDNDYISCQDNGRSHGLASMNIALRKLCDRNGIPRVSVHGLRHIYATVLIEKQVPIHMISALLGHSSIHTTFEYYCEVISEDENIFAFMNDKFVPN